MSGVVRFSSGEKMALPQGTATVARGGCGLAADGDAQRWSYATGPSVVVNEFFPIAETLPVASAFFEVEQGQIILIAIADDVDSFVAQ